LVAAVCGSGRNAQLSGLSVVEVADERGHCDVAGTALPLVVVAAAASAGGLVVQTGKNRNHEHVVSSSEWRSRRVESGSGHVRVTLHALNYTASDKPHTQHQGVCAKEARERQR
jgi:hypothetical protein